MSYSMQSCVQKPSSTSTTSVRPVLPKVPRGCTHNRTVPGPMDGDSAFRCTYIITRDICIKNATGRRSFGLSLLTASCVLPTLGGSRTGKAFGLETTEPLTLRANSGHSLARAIEQAPPGSILVLEEGTYRIEKTLEIRKPLIIRGAGDRQTTIELDTDEPYQPVFQISSADTVTLDTMTLRHRSPSIANNYAVYLMDACDCTLANLDITSSTGTGLSIEGGRGTIRIQDCDIHDCAQNGIGIFPNIDSTVESLLRIILNRTNVEQNNKHGLVIKGMNASDAKVIIADDNDIHKNKLFGLQVSDSDTVYFSHGSKNAARSPEQVLSKNGSGNFEEDEFSVIHWVSDGV